MIRVGTAGWTIARAAATSFASDGRHLERYARVLACAEINSAFHRSHRPSTYARWAAETPADFRFSIKLPRTITHKAKLVDVAGLVDAFLVEIAGLGDKLGVLLVQLPPSLQFDRVLVDGFFAMLRERFAGPVVCEPRHATWYTVAAARLLKRHRIGRVTADPALSVEAAIPGGWLGVRDTGHRAIAYYRWHGAPRVYWSGYDAAWLAARAAEVARWPDDCDVWCIFDNTAAGEAIVNAVELMRLVG